MPRPPLALVYHAVADVPLRRDPDRLFVRPADLRRHLATLRRWGYRLVTLSGLADRLRAGDGAGHAAVTFDDGFADNLTAALPVLREAGATATVFCVSGWLGEPHPSAPHARILTAEQLRELHAAGVEIGAHTASHADLLALSPEAAFDELERGRRELEAVLDAPVTSLAYPYGRADASVRAAAARAGFTVACRSSGEGSWDDPLDLPRQDMDNRCTRLGFLLKRDGRYEPIAQTLPGRALRRASLVARRAVG